MNDPFLKSRLMPLWRRQRQLELACKLAVCWVFTLLAGLAALTLTRELAGSSRWVLPVTATLGFLAAAVLAWRHRRAQPDWRRLARLLEVRHPELEGRLLTAVQAQTEPDVEPGFLQRRLVDEVLDHSYRHPWPQVIPWSRVWTGQAANLLALGLVVFAFTRLQPGAAQRLAASPRLPSGITVTPGDTQLERGESLVVMARFGGPVPANVDLVVREPDGSTRRIALVKSLSDPMFGGTVPGVSSDLFYKIEFGEDETREFKVTTFEYPRLERADANLTYPVYTRLEPKRIEDTRRLSAVEGTRIDLALQLNKPVVSARLVPPDRERTPRPRNDPAGTNTLSALAQIAEDSGILPAPVSLLVATNQPSATLEGFTLEASGTYHLELVDADGRTNKLPASFVFSALKNRTPELKIASPRGDSRPSALEEIAFEGSVWDDFGVEAHGLAYTLAGQETRYLDLGRPVPAREQRPFRHLLRLEDLGVAPDQLLAWYVWADDIGPDGAVRRTAGDMYFAEVRPFDEIFREGQGAEGQQQQQGQQPGEQGEGSPSARLAELQKQIINATWRLQRDHHTGKSKVAESYSKDATVVRDSQAQALEQATEASGETRDARTAAFWKTALKEMELALAELEEAVNSPEPLPTALAAEQSAYQALLRLQQREYEVTRNRNRSQGQQAGGRQQQMQRQLDQLELTQDENRYETERQAQAPQSSERREQLQVLNRLAELARRQQDVNERLKELQTALQEARTEQEREELRRELKRLQEEQREMLADVDELQQRMDRAEEQSRMADQRQQLDQARQDMQRAAEATEQGAVSQALAAGTRAQRQMQDMRDELRRESAGEFGEELREMRSDARELSRRQEAIQQELDQLASTERQSLSDSAERQQLVEQLADQKGRLTNLVERATQVSQQAEASEPLVSQHLYDAVRRFTQDDGSVVKEMQQELLDRGMLTRSLLERLEQTAASEGAKSLEVTAEMLRQGYLPQADSAEERARAGIDEMRRGVERAAERVLGDDTEALRTAQRELDALTEQIEREVARAERGESATADDEQAPGGDRSEQGEQNREGRQPGEGAGERQPGRQPGEGNSQQAQAGQPQNQGQPGQGQGQGQGEGQRRDGPQQAQASGQPGPGEGEQNPGETGAAGQAPGDRAGAGRDGQRQPRNADQARDGSNQRRGGSLQERGAPDGGGGGGVPVADALDQFMEGGNRRGSGPITGEEFGPWSDRLREVEEMVDLPSLRSDIATARERARQMRQDFRREQKKPDWAVVRLDIVKPLVEVRQQIAEELARREPASDLVPIDRDPVPVRFAELVRRYYEELGKQR